MPSLPRAVKVAAAGGLVAGAAALAALAANPAVKDEARRLSRLARPLGKRDPAVPVPPPLPPGRVLELPERGEVFVRDSGGSGPAVLLLHGWTLTADLNFWAVYPELAGYRVVAVDHRGHGRGMRSEEPFSLEACADDAAAVLEALGVRQAVVAGFSMGGAVAMLVHHRHPQLVSGLVFSATALEWKEGVRDRMVWRGMSLFEVALRNGTGDGVVARVARETIEEAPHLAVYQAWAAGEFHRGYPPDLAGAGRAMAGYDGRALAEGVEVPAAVVLTTGDRMVAPARQQALAEALGARVFEVDGDHTVFFADGPAFGAAIRAAVEHAAGARNAAGP